MPANLWEQTLPANLWERALPAKRPKAAGYRFGFASFASRLAPTGSTSGTGRHGDEARAAQRAQRAILCHKAGSLRRNKRWNPMQTDWQSLIGAPPPGTRVCPAADLGDGVLSLVLETEAGAFPLLVLRADGTPRAWFNACPHQYLPLDYRSPNILSADRRTLICSVHQARFDAVTGEECEPQYGCALEPVPVIERDGVIFIRA